MGRYVSVDELKAWGFSTTVNDRTDYGSAILAAEQALDNACQRRFIVASASSALSFRPETARTDVLWIQDCTTVTSVVEYGTTLTVDVDYVLEPTAAEQWSGETRPYSSIRKASGASWYSDGPIPRIVVTATWGWAAIPPGAVEACKVAAKAFLDGRDITFGLAGLTEGGGVSEREAKAVRDFVRQYQGHHAIGLA